MISSRISRRGSADEVADRIDRSKTWIVRQAVTEWLAEELALDALKDADEVGRDRTKSC